MEKTIGIRVPDTLLEAIETAIQQNNYATYSEYIRAAIREKLERENQ